MGDADNKAKADPPAYEPPILTEAEAADKQMTNAEKQDVKVPADLSKVSNARARELVEAGAVEDKDLPAKMYKRKQDGFVARIPNYIYEAYLDIHKAEWDEITLASD